MVLGLEKGGAEDALKTCNGRSVYANLSFVAAPEVITSFGFVQTQIASLTTLPKAPSITFVGQHEKHIYVFLTTP